MTCPVVYAALAARQIENLSRYIETAASATISERYIAGLIARCDGLADFPLRGTMRDDLFGGCRILNYRRRTIIAFKVEREAIIIIGVFDGGQNYEAVLRRR